MSNLLQLWREVCERSPALVNPQGKHLIVNESDCMLLGCEIERACLPPAPPSVVETLASGWQQIATAPKEMELLGWREDCGPLLVMHTSFDRFASERECDETDEETLFQKDWFGSAIPGGFERLEGSQTPTHWMPLPAAPTDEVENA